MNMHDQELPMGRLLVDAGKNDGVARAYRINGNKFFHSSSFHAAVIEYNKGLCHAVPGSVEMGRLYANRSAAYSECRMYVRALQNITLALDNGYPENLRPILYRRTEQCEGLSAIFGDDSNYDPWTFIRLSYPPHDKIPYIANCLELRTNKAFGRMIVTNRDLNVGDFVAIEEPLFHFISPEAIYHRCSFCMKGQRMSLIPCHGCPNAMFCSSECQQNDNYHPLQCPYEKFSELFNIITRMKQRSLKLAGNYKELLRIWETSSSPGTVFDYDLSERAPDRDRSFLIAASRLSKNATGAGHSIRDLSRRQLLMASPVRTEEEENKLLALIREQFVIYSTNAFKMYDHDRDLFFPAEKEIGGGLLPFGSLFNHSCFPNVSQITVDNKCVFMVARPITAGEQLFISYGPTSSLVSRTERRNCLEHYVISCRCIACRKGYGKLETLRKLDPTFRGLPKTFFTAGNAIKRFQTNCRFIENNSFRDEPIFEVECFISHNEYLMHGLAKEIFDNAGQGREINVLCLENYHLSSSESSSEDEEEMREV